jgi:hypothetical protein
MALYNENVPLKYLHILIPQTRDSLEVFDQLYAEERKSVRVSSTPTQYLNEIHPKFTETYNRLAHSTILKGASIQELREPHVSLGTMLKSIFVNACVLSLEKIMELVGPKAGKMEVLKELEDVAVFVRGVWIIKRYQYPQNLR